MRRKGRPERPDDSVYLKFAKRAGCIGIARRLAIGHANEFCQCVERIRLGLLRRDQPPEPLYHNARVHGARLAVKSSKSSLGAR